MAKLDLVDVRKTYAGKVDAVQGVNLSINDGELVVLVGPSGCGKSTLLRMIAGLEGISAGTVSIDGRVVNAEEPSQRDIAMVFQNYALYPHMNVRQNLEYGLKNRRVPKPEIARRVAEAARFIALEPYLERMPRQLSGGQRQRVAMGRAIVREPKVFLFDEPLSNLDAKLRVQMRGEIKQLQQRLGTTSVYVTHDQLEAMTLADRLVVLNAGRIEQIGTPLEVYRRPQSIFVAGFIGSPAMNIVTGEADGTSVQIGSTRLPLDTTARGEVLVGMRAEDLLLTASPDAATLPLLVRYIEELGAQRLVHGHVHGQPLTASLPVDLAVPDLVQLSIAPSALHVFDKASGKRVG